MLARISALTRSKPPVTAAEGLLSASGSTVPTDGTSGYQPGAVFQDTTNGKLYVNEGTLASSSFKAVVASGNNPSVGNLTVTGTLGVTGEATFTVAPKLTEEQAAGSETATMANAPVTGNPAKYLKIKLGATTYQFPVWALPS